MPSLNEVRLLGHVGNAPEVRSTNGAVRVATFSLATSEKWTDNIGQRRELTQWHRIVCWNSSYRQLADQVERYVEKGNLVLVSGKIEYRQWQDKDGVTRYSTEIKADRVTFLTPRKDRPAPAETESVEETEQVPF